MVYYIKTQLNRSLTDKYFRLFIIGILSAVIVANLSMTAFRDIIYGMNDGTFAYNLIMFAKGFFWIPYYATIFVADEVIGPEYPDPRIRDKSTSGLTRKHIYFGKLITGIIVLLLCAVIATVAFLVITPLFQVHDGTIDMTVILDFLEAVILAMPLFIAGLSIAVMFCFARTPRRKARTRPIWTATNLRSCSRRSKTTCGASRRSSMSRGSSPVFTTIPETDRWIWLRSIPRGLK